MTLAGMEPFPRAGHSEKGGGVASRRLPAVLGMAVASRPRGGQHPGEPGASGFDLPHGSGGSNLGSSKDSRGTAQVRVRHLGTDCLAMASTSSETTDPGQRWLKFLRNQRDAIAAMDFFTVPTFTCGVLHCFFVIGHDRRKILRFNLTRPNTLWIVQQMREAVASNPSRKRHHVVAKLGVAVESRNRWAVV